MQQMDNFLKIDQNNAAVFNRLKVLKLIIEKKNIKRVEIAKQTGLQTSTLTYIIQDLKNLDLIKEAVSEDALKSKGVKPNIITLNEEDNYVMGFDIKPGEIKVVVKNLADRIIHQAAFKMVFSKTRAVEQLAGIYTKLAKDILPSKKILGVGIGLPGVVSKNDNEIIVSNLLKIEKFPLGKLLSQKIKVPVFLENNANAAAYGDYIANYRQVTQNLFLLLFHLNGAKSIRDIAVGSGLIINREVYYGDFHAAGEIGDIFDGIISSLAKDKDAQALVSKSLLDQLKASGKPGKANPKDSKLIRELGFRLGEVISNVINIINPSVVLIAGDHSIDQTDFFQSIKEGIKDNLVSFIREKVRINKADFGEYNISVGAAFMASREILTYQYFNELLKK
ncbi:MAG: ROK family transcriptional regulator [Spirochaetes bacterium]|nr:ROK family transcriptional regulator [Spirochaetota bacterium]